MKHLKWQYYKIFWNLFQCGCGFSNLGDDSPSGHNLLHWGRACEHEPAEYGVEVLVETTVAEINEKLFDAKFGNSGWLAHDLML